MNGTVTETETGKAEFARGSHREALLSIAIRQLNNLSVSELDTLVGDLGERNLNKAVHDTAVGVSEQGPSAASRPPAFNAGLRLDNVEEAFTYQPWGRYQKDVGDQVRDVLVAAAKVVLRLVPDGPDKSVGLRKLREARMDFNSAITHNGRF